MAHLASLYQKRSPLASRIVGDWLTYRNILGTQKTRANSSDPAERFDTTHTVASPFHIALNNLYRIMRTYYGYGEHKSRHYCEPFSDARVEAVPKKEERGERNSTLPVRISIVALQVPRIYSILYTESRQPQAAQHFGALSRSVSCIRSAS